MFKNSRLPTYFKILQCVLLSGKGAKGLACTRGELTLLRDGSEKKISQQRGRIGVNNMVARNHLLKVQEC